MGGPDLLAVQVADEVAGLQNLTGRDQQAKPGDIFQLQLLIDHLGADHGAAECNALGHIHTHNGTGRAVGQVLQHDLLLLLGQIGLLLQ